MQDVCPAAQGVCAQHANRRAESPDWPGLALVGMPSRVLLQVKSSCGSHACGAAQRASLDWHAHATVSCMAAASLSLSLHRCTPGSLHAYCLQVPGRVQQQAEQLATQQRLGCVPRLCLAVLCTGCLRCHCCASIPKADGRTWGVGALP